MRALRRFALPSALALALGGAAGCAAPAGNVAAEGPRAGTAPDLALFRDGRLVLRYPGGERGGALLAAGWRTGSDVPAHQVAMLAPAGAGDRIDAADAAARVTLLGPDDWDAVMWAVLGAIVPDAPDAGTLVVVQGRDVVVHRGLDGTPRAVLHERKPADLKVTRTLDEETFARLAAQEVVARHGASAPLLFATGDPWGTLLFFDPRSGSSAMLVRGSAPTPADAAERVGQALRLSDALLLRSHVVTPLVRPFTAAGRLAWLAGQSLGTLLPRAPEDSLDPPPPVVDAAPMDAAAWEAKLDGIVGPGQRYRGAIEPLIDGEAFFTAFVQSLQDARSSIDVRLYIFDRDDYALGIADLLKRRSRDVRVRVLVDYLGSLAAGQTSGPRVPPYQAPGDARGESSILDILSRDSRLQARAAANPWLTGDHTKTILVDRTIAFAGGMNIGHEYRYVWHDMMVALRGPVVGRLASDFDRRWAHAGPGGDLAFATAASVPESFDGPADDPAWSDLRVLYTRTGDPQILRAQVAAMRAAKRRIWIEQAYVADDTVIAELVRARRRGVDVRVVLPSRGDSGFMDGANLVAANAFVRNGIRVYAYPGMTHVKAALYDGWAIVGSANFDKLSLRVNLETDVGTSDPRFVERLERELFERDFARAVPVTAPRPVGWSTYFASFVAGQL